MMYLPDGISLELTICAPQTGESEGSAEFSVSLGSRSQFMLMLLREQSQVFPEQFQSV